MEDSFAVLLELLGYEIKRKRDVESGLDVIAKFSGKPIIKPEPRNSCELLPPSFAPSGFTAFSLKRGDFRSSDVAELIEKVNKAKNSKKEPLNSLEGMVIVTNYTKKEKDIDKLLSKKVYCWDGRRLIFYSVKAKIIQELVSKGPVEELPIEGMSRVSYLKENETSEELKNLILTNIALFIDDHDNNLMISSDHIEKMLKYVYEKSLKPIVDNTRLETQVFVSINVLGIASDTAEAAYEKYAKEQSLHPKVFFLKPMIFQYGAAPWTILYRSVPV
jgi:hypothetical protein